jgi:hypothetical protein
MKIGLQNRIECFPPGSKFAKENGCACAVMDNHYGKGRGGNGKKFGWFMTKSCPLHGWSDEDEYE